MTEATHTPGPWRAHPAQEMVWAGPGSPDSVLGLASAFGNTRGEVDANARLIAAAPTMLAALERLLAAHDSDVASGSLVAAGNGVAAEQARAAVALATGKD